MARLQLLGFEPSQDLELHVIQVAADACATRTFQASFSGHLVVMVVLMCFTTAAAASRPSHCVARDFCACKCYTRCRGSAGAGGMIESTSPRKPPPSDLKSHHESLWAASSELGVRRVFSQNGSVDGLSSRLLLTTSQQTRMNDLPSTTTWGRSPDRLEGAW